MTDTVKILIAEDEEFIANLYKMNLEQKGVTVDLVHTGKGAVEYMDGEQPDLLLLDLLMPEMDGFQALKEIREKGVEIPIVILTNLSQDIDRKKCQELGAQDFFVKSDLSIEDLWTKISEYVQ